MVPVCMMHRLLIRRRMWQFPRYSYGRLQQAMVADLAPFACTVGGGFFVGFITGYAIKKVIKLAAVIIGLFIAALAYLQYQRILNVDWERVQAFSQNGTTWLSNALAHISSTIITTHSATLSNVGIPLVSSVSAGFVLGMVRG